MILLLLILDILLYNYTKYNSFFFLIALNLIKPKDYLKVIIVGLFLDLIILNQPFINTICLLIVFILNQKIFPIKNKTLFNFLVSSVFNFLTYILFISVYNQIFNFYSFIISLLIYLIFIILSYNYLKKYIKLVR